MPVPRFAPGTLRGIAAGLLVLCAAISAGGCGTAPRKLGEPVDVAAAIPLSELLSSATDSIEGPVVVSGRVGEICESAGCWFVLEEVRDGKVYQVMADLKPSASFTVARDLRGESVVARGQLVGEEPDLRLNVVGLVLR